MINIGIIGTGNIGTDLLLKSLKTNFINPIIFCGRRNDSDGILIAQKKGVPVSVEGINYFLKSKQKIDLVYDCTNAADAKIHAEIFKKLAIKVIDLTPSKVGAMCVPEVNPEIIFSENNVNMITCGGQASIPLLHEIAKSVPGLKYIEIVSQAASKSAGMATRLNIDNYIHTTQNAISQFTACSNNKVILNLNPAEPCVDMQTTMFLEFTNNDINLEYITQLIEQKIIKIKNYIPFYDLAIIPTIKEKGILVLGVRIRGTADYFPAYAGNLDIINCAAIKLTQILAEKN
jgi:acetaldehyde dehydrogenase (acetylating)